MNIEYTKIGDYLLPNLVIDNKNYEQINKYELLRLNYIKENKKGLYTTLLMRNELTSPLLSVSNECEERLKTLMNNYIKNDNNYNERIITLTSNVWCEISNNDSLIEEEVITYKKEYNNSLRTKEALLFKSSFQYKNPNAHSGILRKTGLSIPSAATYPFSVLSNCEYPLSLPPTSIT